MKEYIVIGSSVRDACTADGYWGAPSTCRAFVMDSTAATICRDTADMSASPSNCSSIVAPMPATVFCTKHNGRQLGSKVFICNKLDVSKHPCSTLQHVMLNPAAMYRPVQCPAVNTQYYMIYYYISL